jgi:ribonuclease P protein component
LRQQSDFQRLRAEGQSWHNAALLISAAPNSLSHNRYGFVVGKRLGKAVVRNRLRRQLREAMRSIHDQLRPGFDMAVIARQPSLNLTYWELRETLIKLMRRAALWVE